MWYILVLLSETALKEWHFRSEHGLVILWLDHEPTKTERMFMFGKGKIVGIFNEMQAETLRDYSLHLIYPFIDILPKPATYIQCERIPGTHTAAPAYTVYML